MTWNGRPASVCPTQAPPPVGPQAFQLYSHHELFASDDEGDEPVLTLVTSLAALGLITLCVAACSE